MMFSPADVLMAGEVLTPGQDGYDEAAATVFAAGTPDLVVRPRAAGVAGDAGAAVDAGVAAAYPAATYQRLAEVKQRYDPGNVFRRNHNIRPAGARVASAGSSGGSSTRAREVFT